MSHLIHNPGSQGQTHRCLYLLEGSSSHSNNDLCLLQVYFLIMSLQTRTTRMPAFWEYPPPPHDYPYYSFISDSKSKQDKVKVTNLKNLPKIQILELKKNYMQPTLGSCLIRYVNGKLILLVLWELQSRHDAVHRQTDERTDGRMDRQTDGRRETSIPPFQLHWSRGHND